MKSFSISFLLLILYLTIVSGVERSKFKTCQQSGFCNRHRTKGAAGEAQFSIDSATIVITDTDFTAKLIDSKEQDEFDLEIKVFTHSDGVSRVKIYEPKPNTPRYEVPDIILDATAPKLEAKKENDKTTLKHISNSANKIIITYKPLKIEFMIGEDVVLVANEKNLMAFEYMKLHPAEVAQPVPKEDGSVDAEEQKAYDAYKKANKAFESESFGGHSDSKPNGNTAVAMDFTFNMDHVYGIPEHADSLSLKNTMETDPYRLWNLDVFEYELDNPMALYGHIPFMVGHSAKHTVGMLWLNAAELWVDINDGKASGFFGGKSGKKETHWISESGIIDISVFHGPAPKDVSRQYSVATGTTYMPPKWSLAYHQCRWNYNDIDDLNQVHAGFDKHDIPVDILWLDIEHTDGKRYFTWHPKNFLDPLPMQEKLKLNQRKLITIVDPHIKRDSNYIVHQECTSKGYYVKDKNDNDFNGHCWPGASSWPDFTMPEVREFWADMFSFDKYKGSTDILHTWNDMNEPSVFNGPETTMPKDLKFAYGFEHRDVHNIYGLLQHRATAEGLIKRSEGKERPFVLSRAFFASTQRYGAIWTGDNAADWGHLAISAPMLLSINIAGLPFCGADVGGFFKDVEPDLFVRWYQAGIFYPFFRSHAHLDTKRREPWLQDEDKMNLIRAAIRVRYTILSYIYTMFFISHHDGSPLMRPLWYDFSKDSQVFEIDDTYMFGDALLISPAVKKDQTHQDIYFPGNEAWYHLLTGVKIVGPGFKNIETPMDYISAYQKAGSVVPLQNRPRRASPMMEHDPYTLRVALTSQGESSGSLFLDDGHTFNYQSDDSYITMDYKVTNNKLTSTLNHKGTYVSKSRIERIEVIGLGKQPNKVVLNHNGKTTDLTMKYNKDSDILTIKDPAVSVTAEWSVTW